MDETFISDHMRSPHGCGCLGGSLHEVSAAQLAAQVQLTDSLDKKLLLLRKVGDEHAL